MRRVLIAVVLAVSMAAPVAAQQPAAWMINNLDTECAPMKLRVNVWGHAEGDSQLRSGLWNAAESRLRAAGVYESEAWQDLIVSVGTLHSAGSVELTLLRAATDSGYGKPGLVVVWTTEHLTIHGDEQRHRQAASGLLDEFIAAYLRANPECG